MTATKIRECPHCIPNALDMWLAVLDGNEEAQALFVTGDGLSAVLSVTADKNMPEELRLVCVMFLECLVGWVLEDAVKKGAHPSTLQSAKQAAHKYLGSTAATLLAQSKGIPQLPSLSDAYADCNAQLEGTAHNILAVVR
eukprot:jgi/Chrzof1/3201/Cz12g15190.t1